jgi:hypothetical protein
VKTLVFLAAACLTGQLPERAPAPAGTVVVAPQQRNYSGYDSGCRGYCCQTCPADNCAQEHRGLLRRLRDRLHQLFHCRRAGCDCHCCTQPVKQPIAVAPVQVIQPRQIQPVAMTIEMPTAVTQRFQQKIGHEDDYSWITGQLHYVHADGGLWVLRYATVDTEDKFGGSVVLAPAVNMKNFREGDLVSVRGEVLSEERASRALGGPRYRAVAVDMIDRAD